MRVTAGAGLFLGIVFVARAALAQEVTVSHGTSLIGQLHYGADFTHLEYVNPNAAKGGEVRQYSIGTFDSLNPFILKGSPAGSLGMVYETLMDQPEDEASTMYGLIAESIETPADYSWVAFNLRPEARWHDGKPITSKDVIFSFKTLTTKGHPFYRAYYADVSSAEALGPHKVKFTFSGGVNRELPHIMGQLNVLPKHYFETVDFEKTTLEPPLASGPYRVAAVEPGRSITLERVADYWGADLPINIGRYNFDRLHIDYYRDQTVALEAFKAHEYDFRMENSAKRWATGYDSPALGGGLMIKEEIRHQLPTGMQAFVFNLRRPMFRDRRVRQAIGHAFDFEWANKTLFYGQYARTESYFSNSDLAARDLPSAAELAYLEPLRGQIPDEVFTTAYEAPMSDGSGSDRRNLRAAKMLLEEAGWRIEGGKLRDPESGEAVEIEFLLVQPDFERIVQPFVRNLERLGITGKIRTVDTAQYQNRLDGFDFDIVTASFAQSDSPGNEQRDFWGSVAAETPGGRNLIGLQDTAVDALIEEIIAAPDRESLIAATRALDRVLLWQHLVVPQFHSRNLRVVYWNRFGRPEITPKFGVGFLSWWVEPAKDAALAQEVTELGEQ